MQNNFISQWLLASVLAVQAAAVTPPKKLHPIAQPAAKGAVHIVVQNSLFHVMDDVVLTVPRLEGWMIPRSGDVISLDDKRTFIVQIDSGETRLKAPDLSALLNNYLLPKAKAPIKNITVSFEGNQIVVKGDLHKLIGIPFEGKGTVTIADDSDIRVHFTELKAAGMLKKGVLDALGLKLSSIAQPRKPSRFYIEGDDIILPINALFPPPRITGKITSVRIEGDSLVQVFGPPVAKGAQPPTPAANFIYFRGGRMKYGKFLMEDADLQLADKEPANSFDFSLDHYNEQLQAGYSKLLPSGGLLIFLPDYATMQKPAQPAKKN
ncbi:hypothetical protein HNQ77_000317 [Silvibacterium bohemicum]|uniref:Uncharacterized protein n=1 Tax=Silvibacterium bohemicum TaxID=1577686 RepID=A0A841JRG9_9BACT|nr:hypothetical protein [Silvibacterium bohemicum]MBB6142379.1 hypothetical protein [Silvibacterium bohemicum]